ISHTQTPKKENKKLKDKRVKSRLNRKKQKIKTEKKGKQQTTACQLNVQHLENNLFSNRSCCVVFRFFTRLWVGSWFVLNFLLLEGWSTAATCRNSANETAQCQNSQNLAQHTQSLPINDFSIGGRLRRLDMNNKLQVAKRQDREKLNKIILLIRSLFAHGRRVGGVNRVS
ncbi:MAG: hypothetical protein ABL888_12660, partial [Pirellulaceae bacterium]